MRGLIRMFRVLFVGLVLCLTALSLSTPVSAKSIEIKSENFVLVGNVRESDGKALVLELEQYRQAVLQLMGIKNPLPEIIPVRIYTVSGDKELKLLTGRTDIGGVYQSTIEGPVFILNSKGGFRRGKQARHIALHEYTHHILAAYSNQIYPRWYNEGLANYFATFEVDKKGSIIVGRPNNKYAYTLAQRSWMPTNVLVNSILSYPYKSTGKSSRGLTTANYFYAQSWLAVHYIQSNKEEGPKLAKYIDTMNQNRGTPDVFKQTFDRTPEEFEQLLKAYYKRNKFTTLTITPKTKIKDYTFQTKELDKGEAEFHKAEAMRFFSSQFVKTAEIGKQYDKAADYLGETPAILAARAELATWESEYEQAQTYIDKARALAPKDVNVLRMAGLVLFYKNEKADSVSDKELDQAQKFLMQALLHNHDDIAAHYYYASISALKYGIPSAQALASAETALDYYRSINFIDSNLNMAQVLVRGRKYGPALAPIDKAIVWSRNGGARMQARSMKRSIERQTSD